MSEVFEGIDYDLKVNYWGVSKTVSFHMYPKGNFGKQRMIEIREKDVKRLIKLLQGKGVWD